MLHSSDCYQTVNSTSPGDTGAGKYRGIEDEERLGKPYVYLPISLVRNIIYISNNTKDHNIEQIFSRFLLSNSILLVNTYLSVR